MISKFRKTFPRNSFAIVWLPPRDDGKIQQRRGRGKKCIRGAAAAQKKQSGTRVSNRKTDTFPASITSSPSRERRRRRLFLFFERTARKKLASSFNGADKVRNRWPSLSLSLGLIADGCMGWKWGRCLSAFPISYCGPCGCWMRVGLL